MITKLHELPSDHPLRNTAIQDIDWRKAKEAKL